MIDLDCWRATSTYRQLSSTQDEGSVTIPLKKDGEVNSVSDKRKEAIISPTEFYQKKKIIESFYGRRKMAPHGNMALCTGN